MLKFESEHRFVSREEAEKLSTTGVHFARPGEQMLAELDEIWTTNQKLTPQARSAQLQHVYFPYVNTVSEVLDEANHRALMSVRNIGPRPLAAQRTVADLKLLSV